VLLCACVSMFVCVYACVWGDGVCEILCEKKSVYMCMCLYVCVCLCLINIL